MSTPIHDDEPDTSESVVRRLLEDQAPQWASSPLAFLDSSGTSNAMWRVEVSGGPDVVVRLPRQPSAARSVARELALLPQLTSSFGPRVATPHVLHAGVESKVFPFCWAVLGWIDGDDLWSMRHHLDEAAIAADLATVVRRLSDLSDVVAPHRGRGERGGPLEAVVERIDRWLTEPRWNAADLVDVDAVRAVAAECATATNEPIPDAVVHGDLIPGNLLARNGRLHAVIDWGSAGIGDAAVDLSPAWSVFAAPGRRAFREAVEVSDETWARGRVFALEQAVGAVVYYVPRQHVLGEVSQRTLANVLADSPSQ